MTTDKITTTDGYEKITTTDYLTDGYEKITTTKTSSTTPLNIGGAKKMLFIIVILIVHMN